MVSVVDTETGGYRDLWREKWCQWVTPRDRHDTCAKFPERLVTSVHAGLHFPS